MSELFLCCFPEMHAALRPELAAWPACRRLWPGLPDSEGAAQGCYIPADYPFAPREAAQCLNDMRAMESAALSGVPLQALSHMQGDGRAARQAAEAAELRRFRRTGECAAPEEEALRQQRLRAQKVLLWAWLLEARVLELRGLAEACSGGGTSLLAAALGEGDDDDDFGVLASPAMGALNVDDGLMPPWRAVLEQATVFLPEGAVLVISPRMAEDMAEVVDFAPLETVDAAVAQQLNVPAGWTCRAARLPLWRALGRSGPVAACPQWDKEYLFCAVEAAE